MTTNTITVKVAVLGQAVKELFLAAGTTLDDALRTAGVTIPSGHELRVNSAPASRSTVLTNGAIVTIVPAQIKGGRR